MSMSLNIIRKLYLKDKNTIKEVARKSGLSYWVVYNLMQKNNIQRRGYSDANYTHYDRFKPKFKIKKNINFKDECLKIAGIMLYWAEGAKQRYTVDFANGDPQMIRMFLRFLREICGIAESRLRIYL